VSGRSWPSKRLDDYRSINAAAESFFSTLEHEVLSRHHFTTKAAARAVVLAWCHEFYNVKRRHSSAGLLAPNEYEKITADHPAAA
jgi:transposase InsO family protein